MKSFTVQYDSRDVDDPRKGSTMNGREGILLPPPLPMLPSPDASSDDSEEDQMTSSKRAAEESILKQIAALGEEFSSEKNCYQIDFNKTLKHLPALIQQVNGNHSPTLIAEVVLVLSILTSSCLTSSQPCVRIICSMWINYVALVY